MGVTANVEFWTKRMFDVASDDHVATDFAWDEGVIWAHLSSQFLLSHKSFKVFGLGCLDLILDDGFLRRQQRIWNFF